MLQIASASFSHPGLRRDENEDSFCVRPDLGLFLVADGMGGHNAGEVASHMAVEAIEAFVADTQDGDPNRTWPVPYDASLGIDGNRLKAAFRLANRRIGAATERDDQLKGMATTAAGILIGREHPVVAHVGDSRVYLLRNGRLRQVTEDHSWVSEQVRAGAMTETAARKHPWRNIVTRALAGGEDPEVEVADLALEPGDRVLICSDGLSSVVPTARMEELVGLDGSLDDICRELIEAANREGGPDNITVVILRVDVA